jgi:hypothetical protein
VEEGKSPNDRLLELLKGYFMCCQTEDASVLILAWKITDQESVTPISHPDFFPKTLTELQPYTDKLRVKNNATSWFKICIASDNDPLFLTSAKISPLYQWFDTQKGGAYTSLVQDSDDPADLCDLLFSGPFVDHVRVTQQIQNACRDWIDGRTVDSRVAPTVN